MCNQDVADIECCESDCEEFVSYKTVISEWRCETVKRQNVAADWCPDLKRTRLPARKSAKILCRSHKGRPVAEQNELYENLGYYVTESMEKQRRRDDARRARAKGNSPGGNLSTGTAAPEEQEAELGFEREGRGGGCCATPPEEQAALVSGAGMEWQRGRARGAAPPGAGGRPGVGGSGFPEELEFDADERAGQGWHGGGEGSNHTRYYHQR